MTELDQIFIGITLLLTAGLAGAIFGGWIGRP